MAAATSAAPVFFNPFVYTDKFNITNYMIDGAVICNDPAFYAYLAASELNKHPDIRVLSLGTGFELEDTEGFENSFRQNINKWDTFAAIEEFTMDISAITADTMLEIALEDDYLRANTLVSTGMDDI